jgi:hypothetical protein
MPLLPVETPDSCNQLLGNQLLGLLTQPVTIAGFTHHPDCCCKIAGRAGVLRPWRIVARVRTTTDGCVLAGT